MAALALLLLCGVLSIHLAAAVPTRCAQRHIRTAAEAKDTAGEKVLFRTAWLAV